MKTAHCEPTIASFDRKSQSLKTAKFDIRDDKMLDCMNEKKQTGRLNPIAIYMRVSTDEQKVDSQLLFVEGLVRTHGFNVEDCRMFIDEGTSATKNTDLEDRPQGKALIDAMEQGEITHVFAYKVDRMFRDLEAGGKFIKHCRNNMPNISIITTDCPMPLTTPDGEFIFGMQVLLARREASVLGQRVTGGLQAARENLKPTARAVYGWKVCHNADGEKTMRPNWPQQSVIQWVIDMDREGWSRPKICRQLNAWGIPTSEGHKWLKSTVRRLIVKPAKQQDVLHMFTPPKTFPTKPPFKCLKVKFD